MTPFSELPLPQEVGKIIYPHLAAGEEVKEREITRLALSFAHTSEVWDPWWRARLGQFMSIYEGNATIILWEKSN